MDLLLYILGLVVVASPLLMTVLLGASSLINRRLSEDTTARVCHTCITSGLLA